MDRPSGARIRRPDLSDRAACPGSRDRESRRVAAGRRERPRVAPGRRRRCPGGRLLHITPAPLEEAELLEHHPNLVLDLPSGEPSEVAVDVTWRAWRWRAGLRRGKTGRTNSWGQQEAAALFPLAGVKGPDGCLNAVTSARAGLGEGSRLGGEETGRRPRARLARVRMRRMSVPGIREVTDARIERART